MAYWHRGAIANVLVWTGRRTFDVGRRNGHMVREHMPRQSRSCRMRTSSDVDAKRIYRLGDLGNHKHRRNASRQRDGVTARIELHQRSDNLVSARHVRRVHLHRPSERHSHDHVQPRVVHRDSTIANGQDGGESVCMSPACRGHVPALWRCERGSLECSRIGLSVVTDYLCRLCG